MTKVTKADETKKKGPNHFNIKRKQELDEAYKTIHFN